MKVLIATVQIPFVRGGAERLAEGLLHALLTEGHRAEIVALPFKWYPAEQLSDHMLAARLLDLTEFCEPVDRVIALKFPAYLIPHPSKVVWLLHQHRQAYELWGGPCSDLHHYPNGRLVRDAIRQADQLLATEARAIYTISETVSKRLWEYNGVASTPLLHPPPNAEQFYCAPGEEYLYFPSRLASNKRQGLVLEALAHTRLPVQVWFAGRADRASESEALVAQAERLQVAGRIRWLGEVTEEEAQWLRGVPGRRLYAGRGGSRLRDPGGDAVVQGGCDLSGFGRAARVHPARGERADHRADAAGLALALDRLWADPWQAAAWGRNARRAYETLDPNWSTVVRRLVA